jgi:predicted GIY-YIG superfamily endonuclease
MCVYLICYAATPYRHAKHYLGFSDRLALRIQAHERGNGSKLMAVLARNDIPWVVSRVWMDGDRALEHRLKGWHSGVKLCPICQGKVPSGYSIDVKKLTFQRGPPALATSIGKRRPMPAR